ncbi:hypothetical protein QTL97_08495 [Sporosarcina thermotolerans]|uniref:Uncharacterized protein n=2 Tax=Sporosarcina thermotolerans TaxID=633404 RepID=A0AAW9A662_9BACL|nr:hypothetical protein [Sporosarcina thermotolerans]MDW0116971.1 hypothetical protein [Sporosarcina thermotolerans]WHT47918.1 hypothetical protein QNH10_17860 [Sporosarcina thermotolerans]
MLFFEDEIEKVKNKVGSKMWGSMRLQDPRINGQLRKDQMARDAEANNTRERRNRLLNRYDP